MLKVKGHKNLDYLIRATISQDQQCLICASEDGNCYIWDNIITRIEDMTKKSVLGRAFTSNKLDSCEFFSCHQGDSTAYCNSYGNFSSNSVTTVPLTTATFAPDGKIVVCNLLGYFIVYKTKLK